MPSPVIQNAIADGRQFRRTGLTAILVCPMNALANDQEKRIKEYLEAAGIADEVDVRKYDRGTNQTERERMRNNPPRILLTNYMMLEYLLIRPADRDALFANHRCRFLVLDEVHTYRGVLGSNIALLLRRLRAHLARARQDWLPDVPADQHAARYPTLLSVGTSATIKSVADSALSADERRQRRDAAVQEFFTHDPRPWLEVFAAGVGSPLELRFLRLFEQHGFNPERQVPVSPADGLPPISIADFAVPSRRLAIYVDGAAFHTGARL